MIFNSKASDIERNRPNSAIAKSDKVISGLRLRRFEVYCIW